MATVLVVDDEDALLALVAAVVEDGGNQPLIARNGQDALRVLERLHALPALIVSDVMMPQMGGIALAQRLKDDPLYRRIPFVLMSAAPLATMQMADAFIAKPFDLDILDALLQRLINS